MTLNCELFQSEFSVLSGKLIKNMFPLHTFRPNDYTIEISVLLQIQFFYFLSIILNCVENVLLGPKDSFGTKSKKILGRLFKKNVVPKESFLFVASDVVPILYNKPCILEINIFGKD